MTEQVVTELTIDARGADEGSATYVRAMGAAQAAADRIIDASNAAAAAQEKQTAVMTGGATSITRVAAAWDRLRASIDPVAKAQLDAQAQMNKAILASDNAVKQGLATQEQAAEVIAGLQRQQIAGINAVIAATEEETAVTKIAEEAFVSAREFATGLIAGLGAGVLFSELTELPSKIADAVHEAAGLDHVAETLGTTADKLQELDYAGALFHQDTETMNGELERFSKNLGGAGDSSSKLGKIFAANHQTISGDLIKDFETYANIVEKSNNAEQRGYLITTAFGKGASELGNLLVKGADGVKSLADQAVAAGAVLNDKMLKTAMALDAEFTVLQVKSGVAFKEFAITIAPAVLVLMKGIAAGADLIGSHFDAIVKFIILAGAALLGYFGPAALVAIGDLTIAIGVGLRGAIISMGEALLANPLGLIVGGIAVAIAAVFLFRDQIKSAIGIDVVGIMKDAVNFIIGYYVGAYNSIKDTWSQLPAAMGDIVVLAANNVLSGIEGMINGTIDKLDQFIVAVKEKVGPLGDAIGTVGHVDFGAGIANPNAGAASKVSGVIGSDMTAAQGTDYVGNIAGALGGAWNSVMQTPAGLTGGEGAGGAGSSTGTTAKVDPFTKLIASANASTAALKAQGQALGMSTFDAAKLEEQTKLLSDAQTKGIALSPDMLKQIDAASTAYAQQKADLEALTAVYDTGKQASETFVSTLNLDLMSGTSLWGAFGDAASKALDDIANKALQMAADGVWNLIFNSFTGGGSSSSLSSGGGINLGSILSSIFHFAGGTNSAPGGLSIVGERGPEIMNVPQGAQVFSAPQTRQMLTAANSNAANDNITLAPVYNFNGSGFTEAQARRLMSDNNKQLLAAVPGVMADARRRAARGAV